ncbi:class I lanthipeptide [Lewinella sp. W8]|uniref:class I lanthipeptide n=1 Tax=Lewinella sp. W8 TaxID=2528208 RepID=UPI00106851C3|nr:class I lanthipeptide [Lewinella sp. W8]MTB50740.1 hypothetical protein [Lewinella sp. W8]
MENNGLNLDKERLVRLQEQQLSAAAGGAEDGPGSVDITISPTIGLNAVDGDGTADKTSGSCCKKSC